MASLHQETLQGDNIMCWKCNLCYALFKRARNNYEYWVVTNIFVSLHGGKDYCSEAYK